MNDDIPQEYDAPSDQQKAKDAQQPKDWSPTFDRRAAGVGLAVLALIVAVAALVIGASFTGPRVDAGGQATYSPLQKNVDEAFTTGDPAYDPDAKPENAANKPPKTHNPLTALLSGGNSRQGEQQQPQNQPEQQQQQAQEPQAEPEPLNPVLTQPGLAVQAVTPPAAR